MTGADPAATILALRPGDAGFEVLMVHRNSRGFFGDIVVFPGGKVDDLDVPDGLSADHDLAHRNAAVREFAEETGILLTSNGPVASPKVKDRDFYVWLEARGLRPGIDELVLISRWVTPESAPRRFDTRFYVTRCVDPPLVEIDVEELIGHEWVTPAIALRRFQDGEWAMMRPTVAHLHWLGRWSSVEEALQSAQGADGRTLMVPREVEDGSLLPVYMPSDSS